MRGSHPESVPWDGDVDIQGETLRNTTGAVGSPGQHWSNFRELRFSGNAGSCSSKTALDPTCSKVGAGESSQPKTTGAASPKRQPPKKVAFNDTQTAAH